jgi:hypothetical protein
MGDESSTECPNADRGNDRDGERGAIRVNERRRNNVSNSVGFSYSAPSPSSTSCAVLPRCAGVRRRSTHARCWHTP